MFDKDLYNMASDMFFINKFGDQGVVFEQTEFQNREGINLIEGLIKLIKSDNGISLRVEINPDDLNSSTAVHSLHLICSTDETIVTRNTIFVDDFEVVDGKLILNSSFLCNKIRENQHGSVSFSLAKLLADNPV